MVTASSVVVISLTVVTVSLFGALVAITVGITVDLAIFKSNNAEQQNAMQSSLQFRLQQVIEDISTINASIASGSQSSSNLNELIRDISSINASTVSGNNRLQQLIQDVAVINASLTTTSDNISQAGDNTDAQTQIAQLNTSLTELSQLLQQQLPAIDTLNSSLTQQIAVVQAQIQDLIAVIETFGVQQFPASSCGAILSTLPSGLYWLRDVNGTALQVYCDMTITCGNVTGWGRIINLDFNSSDACRNNFIQRSSSNLNVCEPSSTAATGCIEVDTFSTHSLNYSAVCGRVIVYQLGTPEAFSRSIVISSLTIDSQYLDGISLTHGSSPRTHVWSFPVGATPTRTDRFACPCNIGSSVTAPGFVGDNYFCDSSAPLISSGTFYPNNPLFDGVGCDTMSTNCCSFNNPPWFYRQLPQSTSDDLEMRVCQDEGRSTEGVPIQIIDLYIR